MLVLSVPHDRELSAAFPPIMVETGIFPVDHDDNGTHTFIVNKITDMTCDAVKSHFTMASEIQDAIRHLVEEHCKRDAAGKEHFWFLMSQRPSNHNVAIRFGATCQQCLCLDSLSGCFIWVHPPEEFISYLLELVCFTLKDHPDNEFFDKASPFLPLNVRGAFQLHKQSSVVKKCPFSDTLFQGMDDKWCSSLTVSLLGNPANLVTVQDSGSHEPSDASQVPNRVLMDGFKSRRQGFCSRFQVC